MKDQLQHFMNGDLSRRDFLSALAALGIGATAAESIICSANAVATGRPGDKGRQVTGTGGHILVEQMKDAGVKYLFTNPGSFEVGLFDAFLGREEMQIIVGLHEGLVIAMADGYHKVCGKPGFVNVHVVAGTAQAAGQMYNASRDRSSLIVTAGMIDNETFSDNVLLGARPGFDQKEINRQFTKISWESRNAASIALMLRRAFKVATTAPPGPVYLAIPHTVLEAKNITAPIYEWKNFIIPDEIPPNPQQVETVTRKLLEAKSPLLVLGDEVTKANAQQEALELAELLKLPVTHCRRAVYHNFPRRHQQYVGEYWIEKTSDTATEMMKGRDLVLDCGANDLGGKSIPGHPILENRTSVVCMGLNTAEIGRTQPFDVAMVANMKLALRALIDDIKGTATGARLRKLAEQRAPIKPWKVTLQKSRVGLQPMHPDELAAALDHYLDKDAIVVSENITGSNHFLSTGFRPDEKMWLSNTSSGLGWGVGAATGAKLAAPDRQVVCNIGDGSLMYSAAGFWTQARYAVPVLTVVCNNRYYQTVRQAYVEYGGRMKEANKFTGLFLGDPNISFEMLAKSQGVDGMTVERAADLPKALKRGIEATRSGVPFLIDVSVRRVGIGADSEWYQKFSLANQRTKRV